MKNEIKSFKLEKRKELSACIDITEAYLKKDVKGLYGRCKKGFKLFHDDEAMNIAFPVLKYLKTIGIESIGRFGKWEYMWTHQAFEDGMKAIKLIKI